MAVYFFYGDEDYNIELELSDMSSKLNPDFKSMSYQVLDNPPYPDLITALRLGNKVEFLEDRKTPDWFVDINDKLIQLVAPAQMVAERRQRDKTRRRCYEIDEIIKHQELCTKEWERIKKKDYCTARKMSIVENIDLNQAVREVENIIFTRSKENRAKFVQGLRVQVGYYPPKINNESIIERRKEGNER